MMFRQKATAIALSAMLGAATIGGAFAQGAAGGAGSDGTGASSGSAADSGDNTNRLTGPDTNRLIQPGPDTNRLQPMTPPPYPTFRNDRVPDDTARAFGDETTVAPSAAPRGGTNDAGHSVGDSIAAPPPGDATQLMR